MYEDRISINAGWRFALDAGDAVFSAEYTGELREITLPHDWQIESRRDPDMIDGAQQGFYPREGIGYYRYEFTPDDKWRGKTVRVLFDGVQRFSTVYINGAPVGGHMYGYVPFDVDISDFIEYGKVNVLGVKVDNSPDPMPTVSVISDETAQAELRAWCSENGLPEETLTREYRCGGDRWYSGAGIYRNAWLIIDDPISVLPRGVAVTPDCATGKVDVALSMQNLTGAAADLYITCTAKSPYGRTFRASQALITGDRAFDAKLQINVTDIELWDVESPNLYNLSIEIEANGRITDKVTTRFGFRTAVFDADRGFILNGRVVKLYGADLHHDGGIFGAAIPPKVSLRRLKALKEMGCNAIRCSHNPQAEEFYDLCDELGLLVIDELYDKWAGSSLYFQRLFMHDRFDDLERMVNRDRNHPSIILWSVGNEVEIQYTEAYYKLLGELCARCRELDPSRPVSEALIGFVFPGLDDRSPLKDRLDACVRYGEIVDVFMGNYMEGFYDALRAAGLHKAFIGSEVFSYYRLQDLQTTNSLAVSPWHDLYKDYVAGGFVWAGVDYIGESLGWPCHGWTGCPIDSAGFPKLRAWHMRSQWHNPLTEAPFVKIAVFDESEPYDMANRSWGFPQMTGHWNHPHWGQMLHIAVFTNCAQVALYQNDRPTRYAKPDADEDIAHFYVDYRQGTLRAVGLDADGNALCEQTICTSARAERLNIRVCDELTADGVDIAHVEVELVDKYGQPYTQDRPIVHFRVEGPADIVGVDNGDFLTTTEIFDAEQRTIDHGHALMILRSRPVAGEIRVTAIADGYAPARVTFSSKPSQPAKMAGAVKL